MKPETHIIDTEEDMVTLGASLAETLSGGDVILLKGNLGAGKTTIAKGIAKGLNVTEVITSPTFTYMQVYPANLTEKGITQLVHIDTYRAENQQALENIGIMEFLFDKETVSIIEWPEKIYTLIKDRSYIDISIQHTKENSRKITIIQNKKK
ncbi:MAG: tRNA (adenosine(37)-N6)-threonylcarbamoyltransferase complex ATPase subunit type 1 TsaE [Candidatus Magasanikbacteria bacterium]|nr:tRNA (adenosine(37)-N6)-threonylcarbamoyltransferase complex ATPase subunit type 1 TsaE [Candidatus Magasanikbacteria bacterium]|tara:strand:- start:2645 stop:3100 length:456 start_codon:yes stop_codon:yes gene_type:complete